MESWYVTIESIEQTGKPGYVWYVNAIAVKGGPHPLGWPWVARTTEPTLYAKSVRHLPSR